MKAKNYIPQISVYYEAKKTYNDYNNAIQQAIASFKEFYSRFDERLLTTKKSKCEHKRTHSKCEYRL